MFLRPSSRERSRQMVRSGTGFRRPLAIATAAALATAAGAQTVHEPGWTVSTFVSGLFSPANGLEFDCATDGFFTGELGAGRVSFVDSSGSVSFFASVFAVDEIALNRTSSFLFAKQHPFGPVFMFDTLGTPLGTIGRFSSPTGTAFDSAGNFYVADHGVRQVFRYDAVTLPPNIPVPTLFASGFGSLEGMRFDCQDNLFVTEFQQGRVLQVVPPSGPHITWASGLLVPLNVAFDPCTNDLFVTTSLGIFRVTSPGVFSTFATGLSGPFALVFDRVGNLFVNEFGTGRIIEFTTPDPCTQNCLCLGGVATRLDIKPGSCPNSFNPGSNGVLPVALVGSGSFDVSQVDLSTLRLARADGVGGSLAPHEGPPGPHSEIEDVATPFGGDPCNCHELGGDGLPDLSLKFRTDDVAGALQLAGLSGGTTVELVLTGLLADGSSFSAQDCIRLVPPGTGATLSVSSTAPGAFIEVAPTDESLDGGGFGSFVRTYPRGTVVHLEAHARGKGWVFAGWSVSLGQQPSIRPGAGGGLAPTTVYVPSQELELPMLDGEQSVVALFLEAPTSVR